MINSEVILINYKIGNNVLSYLNKEHNGKIIFIKVGNDLHIKSSVDFNEKITPEKIIRYLYYVQVAITGTCKTHFTANKNRNTLLKKLMDDSK